MAYLNAQDRSALLKLLNRLPLLQTYRGRRTMLENAGLEAIIPQLDLEGSPFEVHGELIHVLEAYGRVTYQHEALGVFLNTIKDSIGPADESQKFIDGLLRNYDLMTPVKMPDTPVAWKAVTDEQDLLEKIIGENTLRHISFLQHGLLMARSVALIDVGEWLGTGFMVSENLMLTNNHVLPNQDVLPDAKFRFNYQLTFEGQEERVKEYAAKAGGVFYTNKQLDFTLVELDGKPGEDWSIAPLNSSGVIKGSRVNIIQHPGGLPKQISFQNNIVQYVDSQVIQYVTSTLGGSSGSPVFDDSWQVVALHHAGGILQEPSTGNKYFRNEGINIRAILSNFPDELKSKLRYAG